MSAHICALDELWWLLIGTSTDSHDPVRTVIFTSHGGEEEEQDTLQWWKGEVPRGTLWEEHLLLWASPTCHTYAFMITSIHIGHHLSTPRLNVCGSYSLWSVYLYISNTAKHTLCFEKKNIYGHFLSLRQESTHAVHLSSLSYGAAASVAKYCFSWLLCLLWLLYMATEWFH